MEQIILQEEYNLLKMIYLILISIQIEKKNKSKYMFKSENKGGDISVEL